MRPRRSFLRPLFVLLGLLFIFGCTTPQGSKGVVIWTAFEGRELEELKALTQEFSQNSQTEIVLLKVPFVQLQKKFLVAAPADQGPDLIIGPQDWLGVFATARLLAPIEGLPRDDFLEVALEAVQFEGKTYAAPLLLDSIALLRNTQLLEERPETLAEVVEAAQRIDDGKTRGFYYELDNFYFSWPFFAAHGAYLFGKKDNKVDPFDLGLDNEGAIQAADWVSSLRTSKNLVPLGATNDLAKSLFLEERLALTLAGPWAMAEIRKAGISYSVDPIPGLKPGELAAPLVGAVGVMKNRASKKSEQAGQVLEFLASEKSIHRLSLAAGRAPAHRRALASASADPKMGKDVAAFAAIAEKGTPMPNHPAMNAIWEPMKQALELMAGGQVTGAEELPRTEERIRNKIRFMME